LAFGAHSSAQWLIPIVTTSLRDCVYPSKVKRVLRHIEFAKGCLAKFSLATFDNSGRCSKVSYVAPLSEDIDLK